jgi:trehalose/maltose hydrolase-like predicted phosphorylase
MHDEEGQNTTPAAYLPECHNNVWIARLAWDLWLETRDPAVLHDQAWPLLRDIAAFFASRCERDRDGTWHLRRVIGPDEAVCERYHGTCDDNVLVNVAVRWLMQTACAAADLVGQAADPAWTTLARSLTVLAPRPDGVIPEHAAYVDQAIKQADTIMAFFPLDWQAPPDVVRATVEFYSGKAANGPLMTTQIEATVLMRLGDRAEGLRRLFARYREYVRGPFLVPFECRGNDTAVMLTGIGGLLQALMAGWYGWRAGGDRRLPRIGAAWPTTPA